MTDREADFVAALTATLDRARVLLEDTRELGVELTTFDVALCDDHGEALCAACLDHWARPTCHQPDHGDACALEEFGAI